MRELLDVPRQQDYVRTPSSHMLALAQYEEVYRTRLEGVFASGNIASFDNRIGFDEVPAFRALFQEVGIDPILGETLYTSWETHAPLLSSVENYRAEARKRQRRVIDPSPIELRTMVNQSFNTKINGLSWQFNRAHYFSSFYGLEEFQTVIDTFGLHNFARFEPEQIHDQVTKWKNGVPITDVVIAPHADWNREFMQLGKELTKVFNNDHEFYAYHTDGAFFFEVNNPTEIGRIAILVGKRERQWQREPNVRNFVILAHGNAQGMLFGVNDEMLTVFDYEKAEAVRKENPFITGVNTYQRHLGNNFCLVLGACDAAAAIEATMAKGHAIKQTHAKKGNSRSLASYPDGRIYVY